MTVIHRIVAGLGVLGTAALLPLSALAQQVPGPRLGPGDGSGWERWHMFHGGGFGSGWGHMLVGGVAMVLFWTAIVIVTVLVLRWLLGSHGVGHHAPAQPAPLDILKARFARGEIDRAEFEERRRLLGD